MYSKPIMPSCNNLRADNPLLRMDAFMRKITNLIALVLSLLAAALPAWTQDLASIKKSLDEKYALTVTTADKTDIVTAGSVLVLKKTGLVTTEVKSKNIYMNTYVNGRITQKNGVASATKKVMRFGSWIPGASTAAAAPGVTGNDRTFVNGEKIWVTGVEVKENGIVFTLFTDAYSDVRYGGTLTIPFEKGSIPPVDVALKQVAEVFDIQADDAKADSKSAPQQGAAPAGAAAAKPAPAAAPAPADAPPPPIAPPPPPPADPKTISLGQTIDQVTANFGQPTKVIKLGAKQIYVYPDMKVTFVGGKVTDVQ
jgi:hypothetical protein